ncbi:beta-1,3-glucan-binding protein-like [Diabrotica undecimpunctata]|uniref:beta-1,3-glucan-binding protein-like n=1 Tax=Diabrotica undecimpunctata TaxID=50387 RepID=UPI003B633EDD
MVFPNWLCILVLIKVVCEAYEIPKVKFEAFSPSGFKVTLPADPKDSFFAFHGKVNQEIRVIEEGDFFGEIKSPTDGYFVYNNPKLRLNLGDEVNYWIYVQHDFLGYRQDNRTWRVTELLSKTPDNCKASKSTVTGRVNVCSGATVFEDKFDGVVLDNNKWLVEQYIPDDPDYEFVTYQKDDTVVKVQNNNLVIQPKLLNNKEIQASMLDLTNGCTRTESKRARCKSKMYLLQNPVISGRIVSKTLFSYVDVEIRAKVPSGEWMYPEIYLEDENYNRLVIAYTRGNKVLTGNDGTDIGGSLLFGGPMLGFSEPAKSSKLSSTLQTEPFSNKFHVYRLRWTPDRIDLYINGAKFGTLDASSIKSSFTQKPPAQARLVLGIGVGGINDFPDDFMSGSVPKPWRNRNSLQVKSFYESRNQWLPSWNTGGQLQVDYVRIKSI